MAAYTAKRRGNDPHVELGANMDFGTILTGIVGLGAALGGGAAGNKAGKSKKIGGDKPWNKVLAPAGAIAVATIYQGVTGDDKTAQAIAQGGVTLGVTASGVFSVAKNIKELVKLF